MPYEYSHHHHHHSEHHDFKHWVHKNKKELITGAVILACSFATVGFIAFNAKTDDSNISISSIPYVPDEPKATFKLNSGKYISTSCNYNAKITIYYGDDAENMANNKKMKTEGEVKTSSYETKYNGTYFAEADFGDNNIQRETFKVEANYTAILLSQYDDEESGKTYIQFYNNDFKPTNIYVCKDLEIGNEYAEYEELPSPKVVRYQVNEDGWYTIKTYGQSNYGYYTYFSAIHIKNCLKS